MEPSDFRHRLENYSHEIAIANSEAGKAFLFLEFVRNSFRGVDANTPHRLYPDLERHIKSDKTVLIKGRVDAFLGNVIIEFEGNLKERKVEEATLFFVRCSDVYLKDHGIIAFVLPRSVFTGDHHAKFRENSYKPPISYYLLFDLEKNQRERVSPLFSVETCVLFGNKGRHTDYPIPTKLMVGRLPFKNSTLQQVKNLIDEGKFVITEHKTVLTRVGERVSWNYDTHIQIKSSQSPYMELFRQGATIVPRSFWFAEIIPHGKFGGGDLAEPYLESSKRSLQMAKKQYKGAKLTGKVEADYIFSTLLGSDLLPFCALPSRLVVIPATVKNSSYLMLTKDATQARGHNNMHQWLIQAEAAWKKGRADKAEKMNIYEWLDYSHKLSKQDPMKRWIVLYNTSGRANLISCVVDSQKVSLLRTPQNNVLKSNGFIAESGTYYYYPKSKDEAHYITAVLNSDFVFSVLKKIKAARHIHKKIWELPIPEYDPANKRHVTLSDLGRTCAEKAEAILIQELEHFSTTDALETGTIGTLRKKIKSQIELEIKKINEIVVSLLQ